MSPQTVRDTLEKTGEVVLTKHELWSYFDDQARTLLGLSGEEAIQAIREGKQGHDLRWSELVLLSTLVEP
jgi:hypothetical protein